MSRWLQPGSASKCFSRAPTLKFAFTGAASFCQRRLFFNQSASFRSVVSSACRRGYCHVLLPSSFVRWCFSSQDRNSTHVFSQAASAFSIEMLGMLFSKSSCVRFRQRALCALRMRCIHSLSFVSLSRFPWRKGSSPACAATHVSNNAKLLRNACETNPGPSVVSLSTTFIVAAFAIFAGH